MVGFLESAKFPVMADSPDYSWSHTSPKRKRVGGKNFLSLALRATLVHPARYRSRLMNNPGDREAGFFLFPQRIGDSTNMSTRQWTAAGLIVTLAALVGVGLWQTSGGKGRVRLAIVREPAGVMGTSCRLVAVVNHGEEERGERAIAAARDELARGRSTYEQLESSNPKFPNSTRPRPTS